MQGLFQSGSKFKVSGSTFRSNANGELRNCERYTMGPQINVIGSFFPSWMLCAAIGIVAACSDGGFLSALGLHPYVGPPAAGLFESCHSRHSRALGGFLQRLTLWLKKTFHQIRVHAA